MRLYRSKIAAIAVLLLLSVMTGAVASDLSTSIDALLANPALKHGVQGVVVESLATGAVLYERNRDIAFVPASNFKLIVSATALVRLGPEFTFTTRLYHTGTIDSDGVIDGDLILVGGGDPVFSTADLKSMVAELRAKGITRIGRNIVADDSVFDSVPLGNGWAWNDEPYYYSAQISALNLDRNVVQVHVKPGNKPGAPVEVSLDPKSSYFTIANTAKTSEPGTPNSISIDRVRCTNTIGVTGSISLNSKETTEPVTMENPALYAATVLKQLLINAGIAVNGQIVTGKKAENSENVAEHPSPPLSKILSLLNKPSDNLIAEVLLKTLGTQIKGSGTASAGEEVELAFLKEAGVDTGSVVINDGSGLSRRDYVTAGDLLALLKYMAAHRYSQIYIDSLPVAGVDGTLRNRMRGTPAEGKVRAKTGYVSHVSALSGYVTTRSGQTLVFSMLMNGHMCSADEARKIQDQICVLLADQF